MVKRDRSSDEESPTIAKKKLKMVLSIEELNQAKKDLVPTTTKSNEIMTSTSIRQNLYTTEMKSCAVLVDSENISYRSLPWILQKLELMGYNAAIRRAYGDFSGNQCLWPWQAIETELSIKQVQAPKYVSGKNTSDAAMMIGAMDMLIKDQDIGCFVLVTSDSDFTPLVKRLKEAGKDVLGFGTKNAPLPLINEYDLFIFIEMKKDSAKKPFSPPKNLTKKPMKDATNNLAEEKLIQLLAEVIYQHSDEDGWANIVDIGPRFPCKKYGYSKVSKYFEAHTENFQMDTIRNRVRIRLSDDDQLQSHYVGHPRNLTEEPVTENHSPKKRFSPPMKKLTKEELIEHLTKVINDYSDNDGWAVLGDIGQHFAFKDYGYKKISKYFEARKEHFQMDKARHNVRIRRSDGLQQSFCVGEPKNLTEEQLKQPYRVGKPKKNLTKQEAIQHLTFVINKYSNKDGWAGLSYVVPHFPYKDYGFYKILRYFGANNKHFEMQRGRVRNRLSDGSDTSTPGVAAAAVSGTYGADTKTSVSIGEPKNLTEKPVTKIDSPPMHLTDGQLIQHLANVINKYTDNDGWADLSKIIPHYPYNRGGCLGLFKYFAANKKHFQLQRRRKLRRSRVRNRPLHGCDASTSGADDDALSGGDGTHATTSGSDGTGTTSATHGTDSMSETDGADTYGVKEDNLGEIIKQDVRQEPIVDLNDKSLVDKDCVVGEEDHVHGYSLMRWITKALDATVFSKSL